MNAKYRLRDSAPFKSHWKLNRCTIFVLHVDLQLTFYLAHRSVCRYLLFLLYIQEYEVGRLEGLLTSSLQTQKIQVLCKYFAGMQHL